MPQRATKGGVTMHIVEELDARITALEKAQRELQEARVRNDREVRAKQDLEEGEGLREEGEGLREEVERTAHLSTALTTGQRARDRRQSAKLEREKSEQEQAARDSIMAQMAELDAMIDSGLEAVGEEKAARFSEDVLDIIERDAILDIGLDIDEYEKELRKRNRLLRNIERDALLDIGLDEEELERRGLGKTKGRTHR